ncbi:Dihydrolipoyl dehydrogenase [uncultured spirochete]|uniref:Dihydrolipoyl dehydrogenase n=1 Tax=uncultured spirochete TaxID=156406 RepID=A0A3P3XPY4_9SPIR|nr:Dihydrolipoyl dehydrogenase [uncultured spirochete]
MYDFNLLVIGAGPGGYEAAIRASQLGLKVAIVDKQWLGGVCLNVGCVPSKALLKNAEVAYTLRERGKEFGFSFDNLNLDYAAAVRRSRQVSDRLTRGVGFLMKKNNIAVHMGAARLLDKNTVEITDKTGQVQRVSAENILIATGSQPTMPPAFPVDGEKVLTYREAILQEKLPTSVVIIGAGAIGLEFATIWSAYGTEVTLVEMLPRIAPLEDEEVSAELTNAFNKRGIKTLTGTRVLAIRTTEAGVKVSVAGPNGEQTLEAEQALVAIGFKPNTANLGLEAIGVALTEKHFIQVDDRMATNIPGIWAIGDVTGKLLLAHVASAQGILCAEAMAGKATKPIDYSMVPRATYSQPQVASFGLTEAQVREKGLAYKVGKFPFMANGKALGLSDSGGFAKLLTESQTGEILGAHLIGPEVSELLGELTLAWQNELTVTEIGRNIHAHPTLSEVVMEAAENAEGRAINI